MYGIIDVGTTGVKLFIYDGEGNLKYYTKVTLGFDKRQEIYFEQDSNKLWSIVSIFLKKLKNNRVRYLGISTYRASVVVWDKEGKPYTNIITWVDRRGKEIRSKLPLHLKLMAKIPMFKSIFSIDSPTILYKWILWKFPRYKKEIENGNLFFGTIDSYLAYRLTGQYVSDATNASLTGLIHPKSFKPISIVNSLLDLPDYTPRIIDNVYEIGGIDGMSFNVLIADQQAAFISTGCLREGCVKVTNGSGSFIDMMIKDFKLPKRGLIPIVIAKIEDNKLYGIEGFIPSTGLILDWLIKNGFIENYESICNLKNMDNNIFFFPLFRGLKIPKYEGESSALFGLSIHSKPKDIATSFIQSLGFLINEILSEIILQVDYRPDVIYCNGGLSRCNSLLQTISDFTGYYVTKSKTTEATADGVLKLLQISSGKTSFSDIQEEEGNTLFTPLYTEEERLGHIKNWKKAFKVAIKWI